MTKKFVLSFLLVAFLTTSIFGIAVASETKTINVGAGYLGTLAFNLDSGQTLSGSISISGGSGNDVNFYATNPQGATILNSGRVSGGTSFSLTAESSGAYTLHFDNSFSIFSSKTVTVSYDVKSPSIINTGGIDTNLLLMIGAVVLISIIVILVVVVAVAPARRRNALGSVPTSQPFNAQAQKKYCTQCGTENDSNALFCKKCGNRL